MEFSTVYSRRWHLAASGAWALGAACLQVGSQDLAAGGLYVGVPQERQQGEHSDRACEAGENSTTNVPGE